MADQPPRTPWDWVKRVLAVLLQLAGAFAGWLTASLPVPDEIALYPRFVVLGALVLAWMVMNYVPARLRWRIAAVATILGVVLGVIFMAGSPNWIHASKGERFFRGVLTQPAEQYLRDNPSVTEDEYFEGSERDPDKVWTEDSRRRSRAIVIGLYSAAILFFTFGLFGAIELFGQFPPEPPPGGSATSSAPPTK